MHSASYMLDETEVVQYVTLALRELQADMHLLLTLDRASAFEQVLLNWKDTSNITRAIDLSSEHRMKVLLLRKYGDQIRVLGEESLDDPNLDLSSENRPVFLLDVVDGTDLLVRELSNWCSAVLVFYPQQQRIAAAFVADSLGRVYYAIDSEEGAYILPPGDEAAPVPIKPSTTEAVADSYLCFYGQKGENLLSVINQTALLDQVKRIYNLGGNPMLAKVANGSIDAVFELLGQKPHDVLPGLYIATKAGAVACLPNGDQLSMSSALHNPAGHTLRYIVACTQKLSRELCEYFC